MATEALYEWAKAAAVFGGVCVGIFAVFSPSWVWLKKQMFGWGSSVLCAFGTILIVASIFRNVSLTVDVPKLEFKLAELQSRLAEAQDVARQTNSDITKLVVKLESLNPERTTQPERTAQIESLQRDVKQLSDKVTQLNLTSDAAVAQIKLLNARNSTFQFYQPTRPAVSAPAVVNRAVHTTQRPLQTQPTSIPTLNSYVPPKIPSQKQ